MTRQMTKCKAQLMAAAAAVLVLAMSGTLAAQAPVSESLTVTETFTIEAIDYENRLITLRDSEGHMEVAVAGPEIQRFSELKVGDQVTFRYYESVAYAIRAAGEAPPAAPGGATVTRDQGPKPGGKISEQLTTSVVVTAIDPKVPSVVVRTDDGKTMGFRVQDKKNIEGVKVGDRVDITYTRAIAVRVESPK